MFDPDGPKGPNGLPICLPPLDCPPCSQLDLSIDVNPEKNCCTKCSGDPNNNIWFEIRPGRPGRCILDELTYEQVWLVLLRNPNAKKDLLKITTDATLIQLANNVNLEVDELDDDQKVENMINKQGTLPYYTLFRGNIDGSIR
jgi:hypothetical protein